MHRFLMPLALVACGTVGDDATLDGDDPVDDVAVFDGAPIAELSDGECPDLSTSGTKTFSSSGRDRSVIVQLPSDLEPGMPALFVWHGLGDSAANMDRALQLSRFADDHGIITLTPQSMDPNQNTWNFAGGGGDDLVLYDDLRAFLKQDLDIDLSRVSATGFSFGALWTTFLTMARADTLSTTFTMSGGTNSLMLPYRTPATELPVLVMWGGSIDTYGSGFATVRFQDTSREFSSNLQGDGHFVVECDHGGGHTVPPQVLDMMGAWLPSHRYGEPSPFEDGIDELPSWCQIPG